MKTELKITKEEMKTSHKDMRKGQDIKIQFKATNGL